MGRGLTTALLVSLGFNILAIGFFGARALDRHGGVLTHHQAPPQSEDRGGFWSRGAGLPPERREAFRAVFEQNREQLRTQHREVRRLHRIFSEAVGAPEWDRATVEAALGDMKKAEAVREEMMSALLLDALETLPSEDRKMMMERGERFHHRRRNKSDQRKNGHPTPETTLPSDGK